MASKIIAIMNQKGGVGKTTLVTHLGVGLAKRGYKVLMVDLDPQGHLSVVFRLVDDYGKPSEGVYHLLSFGEINIIDTPVENLHLIPGGQKTANAAVDVLQSGKIDVLQDGLLRAEQGYDFILIDTPPTTTPLTPAIMMAADYVLLPSQLTGLALEGIANVLEFFITLSWMKEQLPKILGIVPMLVSKSDPQYWTREEQRLFDELCDGYGERVWKEFSSLSTVWVIAAEEGQTVFGYDKSHQSSLQKAVQQANAIVNRFLKEIG